MLRRFLIYLSRAAWARRLVTDLPIAWRTAARFVAGESLSDAVRVVRQLNDRGIFATLDVLGEHTTDVGKAGRATEAILEVLEAIDREGIASGVSIKLTQIGLALDERMCLENLLEILRLADAHETFVRIDMEDSPWVDQTLKLYRAARNEHGLECVGVVIQAYLYRSRDDLCRLVEEAARVRLVKGAYDEPRELAYPKKRDVDANFDRLTEILIDGALAAGAPAATSNGKIPPIPAIATHDERRIEHARAHARKAGLPARAIEFQLLYGIRRDLQARLVLEGYPVRVYVPFGTEWYPYFMRRLAERPANLWFFLANLVRR